MSNCMGSSVLQHSLRNLFITILQCLHIKAGSTGEFRTAIEAEMEASWLWLHTEAAPSDPEHYEHVLGLDLTSPPRFSLRAS